MKKYRDLLEDFREIVGTCNPHNRASKAFGVCVGLAKLAKGEGVDLAQFGADLEGVEGRSKVEWNCRIAWRWAGNAWRAK